MHNDNIFKNRKVVVKKLLYHIDHKNKLPLEATQILGKTAQAQKLNFFLQRL